MITAMLPADQVLSESDLSWCEVHHLYRAQRNVSSRIAPHNEFLGWVTGH